MAQSGTIWVVQKESVILFINNGLFSVFIVGIYNLDELTFNLNEERIGALLV